MHTARRLLTAVSAAHEGMSAPAPSSGVYLGCPLSSNGTRSRNWADGNTFCVCLISIREYFLSETADKGFRFLPPCTQHCVMHGAIESPTSVTLIYCHERRNPTSPSCGLEKSGLHDSASMQRNHRGLSDKPRESGAAVAPKQISWPLHVLEHGTRLCPVRNLCRSDDLRPDRPAGTSPT